MYWDYAPWQAVDNYSWFRAELVKLTEETTALILNQLTSCFEYYKKRLKEVTRKKLNECKNLPDAEKKEKRDEIKREHAQQLSKLTNDFINSKNRRDKKLENTRFRQWLLQATNLIPEAVEPTIFVVNGHFSATDCTPDKIIAKLEKIVNKCTKLEFASVCLFVEIFFLYSEMLCFVFLMCIHYRVRWESLRLSKMLGLQHC